MYKMLSPFRKQVLVSMQNKRMSKRENVFTLLDGKYFDSISLKELHIEDLP